MTTPFFQGACTALVTPFLNGEVNYPMAEQLLRRQIEAGITAVVIAGTTGEGSTLSDSEKIELFRRCKSFAGNSCKIIAGTGSNSTEHAIAISKEAEKVGVDALLVVTPYYNKTTPQGLVEHYSAIAEAVNLPIILYNVPSRTGLDTPVNVYQQLAKISNIIGVKEASNDITKVTRINMVCEKGFSVWSGNDDQIVPAIAAGGDGVISVLSNIYPAETSAMCCAALAGDYETATALQKEFLPLIDLLFCEVNPMPVKAAMGYMGYDCGRCRLPLTALTPEHENRLRQYFV